MFSLSQQPEHSTDRSYFLSKSNTKTLMFKMLMLQSQERLRLAKDHTTLICPTCFSKKSLSAITLLHEFSGLFKVEKAIKMQNTQYFFLPPGITKCV